MSPRWLVFDYGEVIGLRTAAIGLLAAELDVAEDAFEAAYWAEREPYDRGCGDLAYWRAVGARVDREVDEAMAGRLTDTDVAGWLHTNAGVMTLVEELAGRGTALALLSNAPSSFGRAVETQPWAKHFHHLLFSGDLGIAKPDRTVWTVLCERLDTTPESCVFVDDKQSNVDSARAAGLTAERFTTVAALRETVGALTFD